MSLTRAHGAIPMVTWGSWARQRGVDQPDFRLKNVTAGAYDDYIRSWALAAKAWGHPFFLRLNHEMNITCCWPWAVSQNGNSVSDYAAMWRHVHDIFTEVHATNVTWVWCPNRTYAGSGGPLAALYPGDAFVDWTCLDGYNWGKNASSGEEWISFSMLFGQSYRSVAKIAPAKPMMIGETGAAEIGGSKAQWINRAFHDLIALYPKIKAFVWFNARADGQNWSVETSAGARRAFGRGISSSRFSGNDFGKLSGTTIRPLK
jgi:beta-mannanase